MGESNSNKIPLLVICGPTASGKTGLSVELALGLGGEIVCADSMQVYADMQIITARVTEEEMRGVPHHLTGFLPLTRSFSVADYVELARPIIEEIHSRGRLPIVCGGTGLYINALVDNIVFEDKGSDLGRRRELEEYAERYGRHALWERLRELDPEGAEKIHENNLIRVVRAIEVCESQGIPFSEQRRRNLHGNSPYNACLIEIGYHDREQLYSRIDRRVDIMLDEGMVDEARRVYETADPVTAYQAIGYKELVPYLRGDVSLDECVDRIKQSTRRYAKRQLTWFRKRDDIRRVYTSEQEERKIFYKNVLETIAKSEIL